MTAARADAGSRLLRLLAVLTWLARQGRATVTELSERFGLDADELIADLELAACCGLPPYSPDQLMEIIVDDQEVVADLGTELGRPRRLTAAEGFALAASARAILAVPGADPDGALGRALAKLEAVLGGRGHAPRRPARPGASGPDPRRGRRRQAIGIAVLLGLERPGVRPRRRPGVGPAHRRALVSRRLLPQRHRDAPASASTASRRRA